MVRAHSIFPPLLNNLLKKHEVIIKDDMNASSTVNKKTKILIFFLEGECFLKSKLGKTLLEATVQANGIKQKNN